MSTTRVRVATLAVAYAGLVGIIAQACIIPLVGDLPEYLGISTEQASWAVTITLIVAAVATPTCGRLADLFGRRRLLQLCLGMTAAGAFICAVADGYAVFLIGRALQGASTAVIPLGISVLAEVAKGGALRRATAIVSASMGVGTAVGSTFAALVAGAANWHAAFWASGAICVVALIAIQLLVPGLRPEGDREPLDWLGFVAISAGLTLSLLAITHGNDWGWSSGRTLAYLIGGLLLLALAALWELRTQHPLVDLRVSASRALGLVNLASTLAGVTMFLHILALSALLQQPSTAAYGAGFSVEQAGLCLAPAGLTMMLFAPVGSALVGRRGHRFALLVGLGLVACGYLAALPSLHEPGLLVACSALIGAGVGIIFATLPAVVHAVSPPRQVAGGNGVNSLMRSVGTSLASAIAGAISGATTVATGVVTGYPAMYAAGGGCAIVAALLVWWVPARLTRLESSPQSGAGSRRSASRSLRSGR